MKGEFESEEIEKAKIERKRKYRESEKIEKAENISVR